MRAAFEAQAAQEIAKYTTYSKGCRGDCVCQKTLGARPDESTPWEVPVTAEYPYPDGSGSAIIKGRFQLKQFKTAGTCRPLLPRSERLSFVPNEFRGLLNFFEDLLGTGK